MGSSLHPPPHPAPPRHNAVLFHPRWTASPPCSSHLPVLIERACFVVSCCFALCQDILADDGAGGEEERRKRLFKGLKFFFGREVSERRPGSEGDTRELGRDSRSRLESIRTRKKKKNRENRATRPRATAAAATARAGGWI